MFDLVIPVAGRGHRFQSAGFDTPKPLIKIRNGDQEKTLLEWSLDCLPMVLMRRLVLVTNEQNSEAITEWCHQNVTDIEWSTVVDSAPSGQAGSTLVGLTVVQDEAPVMLANCDQWVRPKGPGWAGLYDVLSGRVDVCVPTFNGKGSKWSYVCLDTEDRVACLIEKPREEPPNSRAIVGVFAYKRAEDAIDGLNEMRAANFRVNGEFYTAPSINWLIRKNKKVVHLDCEMQGIGTPEDVAIFAEKDLKRPPVYDFSDGL